jgi:polysaccharide chain length determinant protein (PEP-CTERM system associated)
LPELEDEGSLNIDESVARLFGFLTRRKWWILIPFFCLSLATVVVLSFIPDRFTSTATLLVVQQQVPQRYVVPNRETDLASALQAMRQEVLSRTQLLRMINDFGLYPQERKSRPPEELVALMISNIDMVPTVEGPQAQVQQSKDFNAFHISFTTENAPLAQQVTSKLTSLFTNEYLRAQTEQSTNTTDFLHRQVEAKGKELEVQETRLKDFKLSHVGELPEQQPGNLGILTGLQNQLQNTMASLERAQQQRALLQTQLEATPRRRTASDPGGPASITGNLNPQLLNPVQSAQNELTRLEEDRSKLLAKGDTAVHPDIIRNQREITDAQAKLKLALATVAAAEKAPPPTKSDSGTSQASDTLDEPVIAQLKSSLEGNRVEIENLTKDEERLRSSISQYENRINQTPVREQQEASIIRDTEVLRQQYAELQKKEQESQLATNLEKQQGGQQFRLIDPASLPSVPSYPKRIKISLGGAGVGFVLAFGLALLMEMRDTSFHAERDLRKYLAPPFVLGIPLLPTPLEIRRKRWWNLFQWAAASGMVLVVLATELYVIRHV